MSYFRRKAIYMAIKQIIECVPNFSEGRDQDVINAITKSIADCDGVKLLDVDPGYATNRTVVTFVGSPADVVEAAFQGIKTAYDLIDMSRHQGEHPRFGACDVCPFVPVSGVTMEDCIEAARELGTRLGSELGLSGYFYESAAYSPERKNLATVRSGEYEGLIEKLEKPEWKPDFGPARFNPKFGVVAVGARDFLIAYNVNLNTTSVRRANSVAFDVREQGRVKREGHPITGKIVRDKNGNAEREPGKCKGVKAIGWYIDEYGIAQISMNITDIQQTSLHEAFEACRASAYERGLRVTGSELVGLVPKKVMLEAGKFFLHKQERSTGISEREIIHIAVKSLGLDELSDFDPDKKIIEYVLEDEGQDKLIDLTLEGFAQKTASESPAPGGGSVSAAVGAFGASLGTMVANLSSHKRGWDERWKEFSDWAEEGQHIQERLLYLVDEDTRSFNGIIDAIRLPKGTDEEKAARKAAIQAATKYAMQVPFDILKTAFKAIPLMEAMVEKGNPNSLSDGAVGALCLQTCMEGALFNVKINAQDLEDKTFAKAMIKEGEDMVKKGIKRVDHIRKVLENSLG